MENLNKRKLSAKGESLYAQLTLPKTATAEEIRKNYRRLVIKYHPDKNPDPAAVEKFREITYAYSVLNDEHKRAIYDEYGSIGLAIGKSFGDESVCIKLPWWLKIIILTSCLATCFCCCCCCCCCCCKYKLKDPEEDEEFKTFQENALVEYAPKPGDYEIENEDEDGPSTSDPNCKITSNPFFATEGQQETTFV
ncbi:PREDICTED: dnaJ homolog subfamily C member 5-like [Nicrophorus vespilloides]|uniref:DnaJ homolog subfamily C member 5-like n=1 Tax=Nicrophorus vespilloides TaxID=110193 RepID=A0ABM1MEV0_NICVS|nr:PREDICTED: dnaJ homolog subfamily C member 5-like [Nicrophorus vespilloides]